MRRARSGSVAARAYPFLVGGERAASRVVLGGQLDREAARALERLDADTPRRIEDAIRARPEGDVKRLQGQHELRYGLRVGAWRVIFVADAENQQFLVSSIRPRGDAYGRRLG